MTHTEHIPISNSEHLTLDRTEQPDMLQKHEMYALKACSDQIKRINNMKERYNKLVLPKSWIADEEEEEAEEEDHHSTDYAATLPDWLPARIALAAIRVSVCPAKSDLLLKDHTELLGDEPTFQLVPKPEDADTLDSIPRDIMTMSQVAQLLAHRSEVQLELAIASSLDGILPAAALRRRRLYLGTPIQNGTSFQEVPKSVRCALIYSPINDDLGNARYKLHCTPIHRISPALVIVAKEDEADSRGSEPTPAVNTIAEISVYAATILSQYALPEDAFTIGITYNTDVVKLYANIPYRSSKSQNCDRSLCLQFDTLQLTHPGTLAGARARIRFARAMLCIQHHVHRLIQAIPEVKDPDHAAVQELEMQQLQDFTNEIYQSFQDQKAKCGSKVHGVVP